AIAGNFDSSRQTISKHIQILTECGLLDQRQDGREIYYHLNAKQMKTVAEFIEPFRNMWDDRLNQLETIIKNYPTKQKTPMEQKTKVTADDNRQELFITREFDLPVELLFRAHTEPDLIEQWMGTKVLTLDNRPHGSFRFQTIHQGNVAFQASG